MINSFGDVVRNPKLREEIFTATFEPVWRVVAALNTESVNGGFTQYYFSIANRQGRFRAELGGGLNVPSANVPGS